ncbi:MAG: bacillithiol biosynthesis deacetylase BshB1 [Myxococcota bacterium]
MSDEALDLLAFGPHPDDVELCCGGLLAKMAAAGHRVGVVDMTRGELASNGTPEERAEEAAAAARALGLVHRENLALPDGGLTPAAEQVARVVEAIRRLRPALVLAPWRQARHPDHEATSEIVTRAVFFAGVRRYETAPSAERFVPDALIHYQMRGLFEPSFVVDVTDAYEAKTRAIACYGSQVGRAGAETPTLANAPLNLSALEARDRHHGAMIGVSHGEPFRVRGAVPVDDPVRHLRGRPPALFHLPRS